MAAEEGAAGRGGGRIAEEGSWKSVMELLGWLKR